MKRPLGLACLPAALWLVSCTKPPVQIASRQDYVAEATRTYPGEARERVLQAAEAVLRHGDNEKIAFRHVESGFVADVDYTIVIGAPSSSGTQTWVLNDAERGGAQTASLSVLDRGHRIAGRFRPRYGGVMNDVPVYRLFWKRVDYMLGRRSDWVRCDEDIAPLRAEGVDTAAFVGLCGHVVGDNDLPVPAPLPARGAPAPSH